LDALIAATLLPAEWIFLLFRIVSRKIFWQ